jgi:formate dehydrogenase major subunit
MLRVTIDGADYDIEAGATILDALRQVGRAVPHLCHDDRLAPVGACRMCVVEVDGETRPVASCSTQLVDGMRIATHTRQLDALRKTNLSLLASHYPVAAIAAEPDHPFHRLLDEYGVAAGDVSNADDFRDDSHPYLGVALDRCIHCQRCVRICDEVQGQFVWSHWGRGPLTRIATREGESLLDSGCVACGACVDTCPTDALFDKRGTRHADTWTRSTCVYCGVGCQLDVGTCGNRIVGIRPAAAPVNRGHLCVKGRYAWEFTHANDRITTPLLRDGDGWRAVSWDEALDVTAQKLLDIRARRGADAIGVLGSARATNEENYLAQKFARVVIGTNNVDCCARVCHTPSAKALKTMLGTGAATNHFDDIEQASCFLLCGCNPTENHPVVGARIKQAVRNGAKLIVIDPRRIELADYADIHLAIRPGHNILLLNALAATIIEENLVDADFIAARVDDMDAFRQFVADYLPEAIADTCGIAAADIRAAARLYATSKPAMCFHGLGVTEHLQGTEGVMALINLALLTGNLGRPGSGINPLRGQNNVQGSAQMGCDPASLTGAQLIRDAADRFEKIWRAPIPQTHGLDLPSMLDAAVGDNFAALWVIGYDILHTLANTAHTEAALQKLELVIVQDLFLNETARRFGDVFFPVASVFEKDGTFMNSDRRVQRVRQSIPAPGECRPDWWIIQQLAQRMGVRDGFAFTSPEAIWDEVRAVWPAGAGLSYARIENENLHWPCPDATHPGTPILHRDTFAHGVRTILQKIPYIATSEKTCAEFPLLLTTGRTLYAFNTGTMTGRTPNLALRDEDTLDISPKDADALKIRDGARVRISSRYGSIELPARILDSIKTGELFATFHNANVLLNDITSCQRDRLVHAPEYKVTAVRVDTIDA